MNVFTVAIVLVLLSVDSCLATHIIYPDGRTAAYYERRKQNYQGHSVNFNVMEYGAVGDGSRDDNLAFFNTWKAACRAPYNAMVVVPSGYNFLLSPITFSGPCKSHISVHIAGKIVAPKSPSAWNRNDRTLWIQFLGVSGLTIDGGGIIDGKGYIWWSKSCKVNDNYPCVQAPTAVSIVKCTNVMVANLQFWNSQQMHLALIYSSEIQVMGIKIRAPKQSPNTDGIHLQGAKNVQISNCDIGTGDDCISIVSGSSNVDIQKITCGPGHGISIGSLGKDGEEAQVEKIDVHNIVFTGTNNGARIKTWQGGSGYARDVVFEDITVQNVENPIVIDQYYCDSPSPCGNQNSAVKIEDVTFKNIKGTSSMSKAVSLMCSRAVPCKGIVMRDIDIKSVMTSHTKSECINAFGFASGDIYPANCLNRY
ncbi:hypothetical protein SUGI_1099900 [Cryptomeria japonica]|uniref:probable polygalacturonase At1g80170 n=1 Tax=Cryptomeria japonica TaxID=3369 RepID=UPI0024148756|nr:probable polygalacturonase At1g80170 [Cryptomeria japonica]GLJ51757.1 hypothetical protein SUGI_1099900 [Cryptomeria japonica]